ncbi:MAG: PTS sugar transporter subunit IIC [Lactimicrobium massiliense]|nr:PTS sugar transporter subunit IIC [Lactimicrobium massiliense]MDD6230788.1 PTS sugar transporter subunit IIC [Lactimicrobium massiliense]
MQIGMALAFFVLAIDGVVGTKILHMPLVVCTLIGALLHNVQTGVTIGAACQLFYSTAQRDDTGAGIYCAIAVIAAVRGGVQAGDLSAGILAFGFACAMDGLCRLIGTLFLPTARKAAEKGKASTIAVFGPMLIRGVLAAIAGYYAYGLGADAVNVIDGWMNDLPWLFHGIATAAAMLQFLGIAVVMRNLYYQEYPAALLSGFAVAALASKSGSYGQFACGLLALGIGAFVLWHFTQQNKETAAPVKNSTAEKKGKAEKWW